MAHLQKIVPDKQPRKARDKKVKQKLDPPDVGNELVKLKDDQIKKMIERISSLHTYNGQFSMENEELKKENLLLRQSVTTMKRKLDEIRSQSCTKCEYLENQLLKMDSHTQGLNVESQDLRNDVEMMKILVYRLNVQLERKQKDIGSKLSKSDHQFDDLPESFNWGTVKTNILAPLLNSYEEIVDEKNSIIAEIEAELKDFGMRLEEVLAENIKLQEEIQRRDLNGSRWETEKARLQSQFDVCRKRADLQTKRADVLQEKLVDVCSCYEQKVQAQALDLDRLRDSSGRIREELAVYKSQPQKSSNSDIIVESLKECKSLFEELKKQHEEEKMRFTDEVKDLKVQLSGREDDLKRSQVEIKNLNCILDKQKECNEALNNKIILLKDAVRRMIRSKESLKSKVKAQRMYRSQDLMMKPSDMEKWQDMLRQKSMQIHSLQVTHANEVERLTRKVKYKDEIVKKLLQDQLKMLNTNRSKVAKGH